MLFAASANDFVLVFVSLELITVSFYILNSFQSSRVASLEAGIKYFILSALSSSFLVFGIALIFGTAGTTNFTGLATAARWLGAIRAGNFPRRHRPGFQNLRISIANLGAGRLSRLARRPRRHFSPSDPKRLVLFCFCGLLGAVPDLAKHWQELFAIVSAITILYGNLCAIPQRNLKRLLGYSSIANAGYLLLGIAALGTNGVAALLYYLGGYLFTVLAAFTVIAIIMREYDSDDVTVLAGLNQRSPLLATSMTLAMVSLAGIPPLAGFFGKFLLLKAVVECGAACPCYYALAGVAIIGVVISIYYYFGIIRAIYWSKNAGDISPIAISFPAKLSLAVCVLGMLYLGIFPNAFVTLQCRRRNILKF